MAGDTSLLCVSPADEFTAGDYHRTIEVDPLVFDGGVLGTNAADRGLSIFAVNLSFDQGVIDFVIKLHLEVSCLVYFVQACLGRLHPSPIP